MTVRSISAVLGGAAATVCALVACNSGTTVSGPPTIGCAYPSGTQVALAYPAPSATAVPDSIGQVVVAASPALPNTWQVVLEASNGGLQYESVLNPIAASAVPTPNAKPTFANPTYESSGLVGALPAATTITVLLNNEASNCNAYPAVGSFTSQ